RRAAKEFQPTRADETDLHRLRKRLEVAKSQRVALHATLGEGESLERWRAAAALHELEGRDQLQLAQTALEAEILEDASRGAVLEQRLLSAQRVEALLARAGGISRELSLARELGERSLALQAQVARLEAYVDDRLPTALARLTALTHLQPAFASTQ